MPRNTDDLTVFATRSRCGIRPVEWTFVALCLGLAGVLLMSGLLPAHKRHQSILARNRALDHEIRRIDHDNQRRAEHITDILYDPLTIETEYRNRGGVEPGEILLPPPHAPPTSPTSPTSPRSRPRKAPGSMPGR